MQNNNFLESLDDLFSNFDKVDMTKLDTFLQDILKLFDHVQTKLKSEDEKERTEAVELAQELQKKLNGLAEKAFAASGLSKDKIQEVLANPANFKPGDWNTFKKIEQEMKDYQNNLAKN